MGAVHYMISEAAKRVNVETHVLRYWEEELNLPIGRTEMGHRYYTEENIQLFHCIKELKEQGLLLRDLKELIPDILKTKEHVKLTKKESIQEDTSKDNSDKQKTSEATIAVNEKKALPAEKQNITNGETIIAVPEVVLDNKLAQVQALFGEVVQHVVTENNKVLETTVSHTVSEYVVKEMDFLLQAKERQEEERFKKLDHLIRQQQTNRKEASRLSPAQRLKRLLGDA